ncbi:MAG: SPOR domain-containing protein [Paracoccaceae bacterium]
MIRTDGRWVVLGAAVMLAGCQMGPFKGRTPGAAAVTVAPGAGGSAVATTIPGDSSTGTPAGGERDVEAPKVFNITAKALWDGRPSLGGVWVAHTSVRDPQRVLMRNPANGKSVVGALFRREIDNPGPPLQLSSDAADALGLLAGQPATLQVVALERVEAPAPTPAPAPAAPAVTAQTLPKADAKGAKDAKAATDKLTAKAAAAIDKATAAAPAKAGATKAAAAPATTKATATKTPAATAPAATAAAATPADATLKRAFVQVGIFSVEANAKKAAAQMQKAGLKASVRADQSQGKSFWRVIIGPAASVADRDAMAAKVKALGYPDSYPVSK